MYFRIRIIIVLFIHAFDGEVKRLKIVSAHRQQHFQWKTDLIWSALEWLLLFHAKHFIAMLNLWKCAVFLEIDNDIAIFTVISISEVNNMSCKLLPHSHASCANHCHCQRCVTRIVLKGRVPALCRGTRPIKLDHLVWILAIK